MVLSSIKQKAGSGERNSQFNFIQLITLHINKFIFVVFNIALHRILCSGVITNLTVRAVFARVCVGVCVQVH